MRWHEGILVPFDFEATAADPKVARPVSCFVGAGIPEGALTTQVSWLIRQPDEILDAPGYADAEKIHGISSELLRAEGTAPKSSIDAIITTLIDTSMEASPDGGNIGAPIVGMNLSYDFTLLHYEAERLGVRTFRDRCRAEGITIPVVDVYVLDKAVDRFRKGSRRLVDMARNYHVDLTSAHDASADAIAAAGIARAIGREYPRVGRATPRELHDLQVSWRREQAESLQRYFRSKGDAGAVVDPCWPACYPEGHPPEPEPDWVLSW